MEQEKLWSDERIDFVQKYVDFTCEPSEVYEVAIEMAKRMRDEYEAELKRLREAREEALDILNNRFGHANAQYDADMLHVISLLTGEEE